MLSRRRNHHHVSTSFQKTYTKCVASLSMSCRINEEKRLNCIFLKRKKLNRSYLMFNSAALAESWEGSIRRSLKRVQFQTGTEGTWGDVWLASDFGNPVSSGALGSDLCKFIIGVCGGLIRMGLLSYWKT